MSEDREIQAALAANVAFYRALCQGDYAAMEALWSASEPLLCSHPGTQALHGRAAVLESWKAILSEPPNIETRDARAVVIRGLAFVSCLETIGDTVLTATNAWVWEGGRWRMVHHQAGYLALEQTQDSAPDGRLH
jgi:hypothetical protein